MHDKSAAASFVWSQFYLYFFLPFLPLLLSFLPFSSFAVVFARLVGSSIYWLHLLFAIQHLLRLKHYVTRKTLRGNASSRTRFFARTRINAIRHAQLSLRRGINAPGDGCFDSRYWNSIDGEEILIISALRFRTPDGETGGKETCSKVKIIHEQEAAAI